MQNPKVLIHFQSHQGEEAPLIFSIGNSSNFVPVVGSIIFFFSVELRCKVITKFRMVVDIEELNVEMDMHLLWE